jgi:hypothetical protein
MIFSPFLLYTLRDDKGLIVDLPVFSILAIPGQPSYLLYVGLNEIMYQYSHCQGDHEVF